MPPRKTHPGSIRKRGPSWRVRLCVAGERHYYTLKEVDREEAEEFAREKARELRKQAKRRQRGLPGTTTLSELFKRYEDTQLPRLADSTATDYKATIRAARLYFVEGMDDPRLEEITGGDISAYLDWRAMRKPDGTKRKTSLSNRSLEKDRAVLHRIFELAQKWELREGNPVARTDPPKVEGRDPVILSDEQYEKLLEEAKKSSWMLYLYVLVLGETGARCESEATWLRFEDVKLEEGFIWIDSAFKGRRTKSGRGRWVPMTPRLHEAMREHFARFRMKTYNGQRTKWIFHHQRKLRKKKPGDRIKSMRHAFGSATDRAKLPQGFRQHDLRHRRVTKWLASEKNPVHVKEAVGHSDLATTMGYTHLAREHLRSLVDDPDGGVQTPAESSEGGR